MDIDSPSNFRPRRERSRKGCFCCRRRRKKCDEQKPKCLACQRNKLVCTWPEGADSEEGSESSAMSLHQEYSSTNNMDSRIETFLDIFRAACSQPRPRMNPELSIQISENLHHYLDHTVATLESLTPTAFRPLWTGLVLEDAKAFPFVMNSLDALSSLHRAHLYPQHSRRHIESACESRSAAINEFRSAVSEVTPDNASGTLTFSAIQIILCLEFPIALERHNSTDIVDGAFELMVAIRGFFHLQPVTCPHITDPVLRAWMHSSRGAASQPHEKPPVLQNIIYLYHAMYRSEFSSKEEKESCLAALAQLHRFLSEVSISPLDWTVLFTWPVLLSKDFVDLIYQKHPMALVILAHWFVPLFQDSSHWLLHTWSKHIVDGVSTFVSADWKMLLKDLQTQEFSDPLGMNTDQVTFDIPDHSHEDLPIPHLFINPLLEELLLLAGEENEMQMDTSS